MYSRIVVVRSFRRCLQGEMISSFVFFLAGSQQPLTLIDWHGLQWKRRPVQQQQQLMHVVFYSSRICIALDLCVIGFKRAGEAAAPAFSMIHSSVNHSLVSRTVHKTQRAFSWWWWERIALFHPHVWRQLLIEDEQGELARAGSYQQVSD